MDSLYIKNNISIKASIEKVWDTLTNPAQTKKYMFGCETVSDWQKGSSLLWKGSYEGKEMVFVKGNITDIDPGKFLSYTVFDPNSAMEDKAENYLTVTYQLSTQNEQTVLEVTQGDYSKVANSEARYKEAYNEGHGWQPLLEEIKKVAESTDL